MGFREDEEIVSTFIEETKDHLIEIENGILRLEDGKSRIDPELVNGMFRAAHSIKAGANLLQAKNIEEISHGLENILQILRQGQKRLDVETIVILLDGVDQMRDLLDRFQTSDQKDISPLNYRLKKLFLTLSS